MEEKTEDFKNKNLLKKIDDFIEKNSFYILLAILIIAFIIRFKNIGINAAVWWDEADYLTLAKNYGLGLPEQAAPWRARMIPMFLGIFYFFGANEWFIKFIQASVSVLGIYLTFLIGKTFFNKKVGLITALMLTVYHESIFWTARISMGTYAIVIWALIAYLFWKGYPNCNKKYLLIAGGLYSFGIYAYDTIGFLILFLLAYLLITERLTFLKKKQFWFFVLGAVIVFVPLASYHYVEFHGYFGESSNFLSDIYPRVGRFMTADFSIPENVVQDWQRPFMDVFKESFVYFTALPILFKWPFFVAFLIGLTIFLDLVLGYDLLLKGKSLKLKKQLYLLLWSLSLMIPLGVTVATTGFYFEPRFISPALPVLFVIAGVGLVKIYDWLKKYNDLVAISVVVLLLILGINAQLTYSNQLIDMKKDSYSAENEAGTWLKEHTQEGDILTGCGQTVQIIYYTEREFYSAGSNQTRLENLIDEYNSKFIMVDAYDPACMNIMNYPGQYPDKYKLVQVFYVDKEKTQPVILVYEVMPR